MIRQTQGAMSEAQAATLGMLSPAAGVAAMAAVLANLVFAASPRAAGRPPRLPFRTFQEGFQTLLCVGILLWLTHMLGDKAGANGAGHPAQPLLPVDLLWLLMSRFPSSCKPQLPQ